jgi:hypothetical protein
MDVRIQNVTGTVTAVGGDALLSPAVLARVVSAVMAALEEKTLRERRARSDTKVSSEGCCGEEGHAS